MSVLNVGAFFLRECRCAGPGPKGYGRCDHLLIEAPGEWGAPLVYALLSSGAGTGTGLRGRCRNCRSLYEIIFPNVVARAS